MRAIILAAGKGERLKSVEPDVPKPMIRIGGKPVLQRTIEHLAECGIRDIVITTRSDGGFGLDRGPTTIRYVHERVPLGTAGGFKHALEKYPPLPNDPVLVWHGDNFSTCDPQRMLEYHRATETGSVTIAVCWRKDPGRSGVVEWDGTNQIVSFEEKRSNLTYSWVSAGIYILEPEDVMPFIPSVGDFGNDVFPELLFYRSMYAYGFSHDEWLRWYDTPEDLAQLRKDYP